MKIETEDDVRFWIESICPHKDTDGARVMVCARCIAKAVYAVMSSKAVEPVTLSLPEPR